MASEGNGALLTNGESSIHLLGHTENETPSSVSESTGPISEDSAEQLAGNSVSGEYSAQPDDVALLGDNDMGGNGNEAGASVSTQADQTNDTSLEDRSTANGEDESANLDTSQEDCMAARDSDMGHSSDAQGSPTPTVPGNHTSSGDSTHLLQSPAVAERLTKAILKTLDCIFHLEKKMAEYQDYIGAQDARDAPLFQWSKFTDYEALYQAATDLNKAIEDLAAHIGAFGGQNGVPRRVVFLFFNSAVKNSISISNTAQIALETMNHKTVSCFEEVEQSSLDEAAKDAAKIEITAEVSKLMKHTTESTRSVYAALDLLLKLFYQDLEKDRPNLADVIGTEPRIQARKTEAQNAQWPMWKVLTTGFLLCIMALTVLGAFGRVLDKWNFVPGDLQHVTTPDSSQMGRMTNYVRTIEEARKYDKKVVQTNLKKFDTRCKSMEMANEELGARLDNIVESLGPPNQDGMYFSQSTAFKSSKQSDTLVLDLQKQKDQLKEELIQLRKHVHLVDLRLTKDVNRLQRKY